MPNGKYLPASNPLRSERDQSIVNLYLQGLSQREIAKQINLSNGHVCMILQSNLTKPDIRALAEYHVQSLYAHVTEIRQSLLKHISSKDPDVALRAIQLAHRIMGLDGVRATSPITFNILSVSRGQALAPEIAGLLGQVIGQQGQGDGQDDDVVDV